MVIETSIILSIGVLEKGPMERFSEWIISQKLQLPLGLKSTQYKKLGPNALRFKYQNLKSCKSHEKDETKNIRALVFSFSPRDLAF